MSKNKINALGISAFCESMTMMLRAGIQTDEAVSLLLEDQDTGGVLAEALRETMTTWSWAKACPRPWRRRRPFRST